MKAPPLSVAMAVHNGMPFLEESVRSILAQSFEDFEFVIGDDGSDDGSSELLRRLAGQDGRIRLLRRERKSGLAASANWVVAAARAPLVAVAHADDRAAPDRLRLQAAVMASAPDALLVGSLFDGIDEAGRVVRPADCWRLTRASPFAPFAHSSIMFRREAFFAVGGYRPEAEYWEDLDLYFRLASRGRLLVVPEILTSVRHSRISTRLRDDQERVENAVDLMFRVADAFWRGEDHEAVIQAGHRPGRKLHPRTFVSRGSTRLWSGRSPKILGRMLRRSHFYADLASFQALVWAVWSEILPRTLRWFIRSLLRLRNLAARRRLSRLPGVEWQPRPEFPARRP
jgi:glycosyltransferase involved in cell wall biosynthesis